MAGDLTYVLGDIVQTFIAPDALDDVIATYIGLDLVHVPGRFLRESHDRQVGLIQRMFSKGYTFEAAEIVQSVVATSRDEAERFLDLLDKPYVAATLLAVDERWRGPVLRLLSHERAAAVMAGMTPADAARVLEPEVSRDSDLAVGIVVASAAGQRSAWLQVIAAHTAAAIVRELPLTLKVVSMQDLEALDIDVTVRILLMLPIRLAAVILAQLSEPAQLLGRMRPQTAAEILTSMPPRSATAALAQISATGAAGAVHAAAILEQVGDRRVATALLGASEGFALGPIQAALVSDLPVHQLWPWWSAFRATLAVRSRTRAELADLLWMYLVVRKALIGATAEQALRRSHNFWRAMALVLCLVAAASIVWIGLRAGGSVVAAGGSARPGVTIPISVGPAPKEAVGASTPSPSEVRFPLDHPLRAYRGLWPECTRWIEETVLEGDDAVTRHRYRCTFDSGSLYGAELVCVEYPPNVQLFDRTDLDIRDIGRWTGTDGRSGVSVRYYQSGRPAYWLEEPPPSRILLLLWAPSPPPGQALAAHGSRAEDRTWQSLSRILANHGYVVSQ